MTPRKAQQARPPRRPRAQSNLANQVQQQPSDYESETPFIAPPTRTNTDLNLSVLQRYYASITTILSIAASAVIYNFLPNEQTWDKAELDGALFVCQLTPSQMGTDRFCIVILNKRGLDNLYVEISQVLNVEVSTEFLILRYMEGGEEMVRGVFIHPDKEETREVHCRLITDCWEEEVLNIKKGTLDGEVSSYGEEVFS